MWLGEVPSRGDFFLEAGVLAVEVVEVNTRTSRTAIQTLMGMVLIDRRHEELSARFCYAISSRPSSFMTTIVREKSRSFLKRRSCFAQVDTHSILEEHVQLVEYN